MLMTMYGHSCVRLEKDHSAIVLDPGTFSRVSEALEGADAILVTHEHADHLDQDAVIKAMEAAGSLELFAPAKTAAQMRERNSALADRIHVSEPESSLNIAGFQVRTFGGQHALIHPHIPMVANIGYLIEDNVYHPGDSFIVPHGVDVENLLVPLHAPWSKMSEVIDFVIAVRARQAFPIHDGLLNDAGRQLVEKHVSSLGGQYGTQYVPLTTGESVEL